MKSANVPHESFREGYAVGYQLILGILAAVPTAPGISAPDAGSTYFLKGIMVGIAAARGRLSGPYSS